MNELTLFDLEPATNPGLCNRCHTNPALQRREHAAVCADCADLIHSLLPNMSYACYENILSVAGHFEFGTHNFENVTCNLCREEGVENIRRRSRWQQGKCVECGGDLRKDVCVDCGVAA